MTQGKVLPKPDVVVKRPAVAAPPAPAPPASETGPPEAAGTEAARSDVHALADAGKSVAVEPAQVSTRNAAFDRSALFVTRIAPVTGGDEASPVKLLRPADWLRGVVDKKTPATALERAHQAFEQRLLFSNFTSEKLTELTKILEDQLGAAPNDAVRFELATVLMQNKPAPATLTRARGLLDAALAGHELPEDLKRSAREVRDNVVDMLATPKKSDDKTLFQANWGVHNRCPLVCKGCYNVFNDKTMSLDECKKGLDKLKQAGVQELVVSGGDPLVWPDIVAFVEHAHALGLRVGIDSTGYTLTRELAEKLAGKVAYIGLPLDGVDQQTVERFRKGKHDLLEKVVAGLKLCGELGIPAKVNTVVHQGNIDQLEKLGELVEQFPAVKEWGWSVFQWWELRAPEALKREMAVDDTRYDVVTAKLAQDHPGLDIWAGRVDKRARSYFFVSANGEVYTFGGTATISTIIMGDLKTDDVKHIIDSPALRADSGKLAPSFRPTAGDTHG